MAEVVFEKPISWDYDSDCILRTFRVEGKCKPSNTNEKDENGDPCIEPCDKPSEMQNFVVDVTACTVNEVCAKLKERNFTRSINSIKVFNATVSKNDPQPPGDPYCLTDVTPTVDDDCQECCEFLIDEPVEETITATTEVLYDKFYHQMSGNVSLNGRMTTAFPNYSYQMEGMIAVDGIFGGTSNYHQSNAHGSINVNSGSTYKWGVVVPMNGSININGGTVAAVSFIYSMSGKVVLDAENDVVSSNYTYSPDGFVTIFSDTNITSSDLGLLEVIGYATTEGQELAHVFTETPAAVILPEFKTVAPSSCCHAAIPAVLDVKHNLNGLISLSRFLLRNNLTMPSITMQYRPRIGDWYGNLHLSGDSPEFDGEEKWTILMNLICSNEVGVTTLGTDVWQFVILVKKIEEEQDFVIKIINIFDIDTFCPAEQFDGFTFIFNTKNKNASPVVSRPTIFYDEAGLFSESPSFIKNPEFKVQILGGSGRTITMNYSLEKQRYASSHVADNSGHPL
jgi:hypothetical protein